MKIRIIAVFLGLFFTLQPGICQKYELPSERRIVDQFGHLSVSGTHILSEHGDTVSIEGMSMFWSQWMDKYYTYQVAEWLRNDWHCEVLRLALATGSDGFLEHPHREMRKMKTMIEACIGLGIYVIIDWHSHQAENETELARKFFSEVAKTYGHYPNIIYEIYNEPLRVSWTDVVKPYHEEIIAAIREHDPDNIIILGTPHWSQDVDAAADDPIIGENLAYTLHFYAGTHKEWLRKKATYAIGKGLALWVTEFGTCNANGDGEIDYAEMATWFDFMEKHSLSWCNWSVADKEETASIVKPGASNLGKWTEDELTESGKLIRNKLRELNP